MGQVKEKLNAVRNILHMLWHNMGMDAPENHEEIVQYVFEDVNECADPDEWHSGDVAIAFRRWIEAQAKENVRDGDILIPVTECSNGMVDSKGNEIGLDGTYGVSLNTVGDLRSAMSELCDEDQITLVTIDTDTGDEQDHYPMHLDVIDGIRLTNGTVVNEVQFVQEMNSKPDTRDKQPVVDALIDVLAEDIAKGDVTVLDELLLRMPFDVIKYALPEDMWADFEEKE